MTKNVRLITHMEDEYPVYKQTPYAYMDEPISDEPAAARVEFWLFDDDYDEPPYPHLEVDGDTTIHYRNWEYA